jgi:hypothetical protein
MAGFFDSRCFRRESQVLLISLIGKVLFADSTFPVTALGRSRPAADATREVVERCCSMVCEVSVGHRRFPYDPFAKNDAGRAPAS